MNLVLTAIQRSRYLSTTLQSQWGDTIRNPKLLEDDQLMRFEVVVANPHTPSVYNQAIACGAGT